MFEVESYLASGGTLDGLREELAIRVDEDPRLVLLNYHQIDSPKSHPIVTECRGLVVEKESWRVVSFPFRRFFNYGELPEATKRFDFGKAALTEKIDGSLISLFFYRGEWRVCTRGKIDAGGEVGFSEMTFRDLFQSTTERYPDFWAKLDPERGYYFELVSPENRVVTPYREQELYLLTVRHRTTWREVGRDELEVIASELGVRIPRLISFRDEKQVLELARTLETLDEGFVAVDYSGLDDDGMSFRRLKIKNPSYVAIAHLKDSAANSLRSIVHLVATGEEAEFLSYFPEFAKYVAPVKKKHDEFMAELKATWSELEARWAGLERTGENTKAFALLVKDRPDSAALFALYHGKASSVEDFFRQQRERFGEKSAATKLMALLRFRDRDFVTEE